jgi:hypothetical protein
MEAWDIFMIDFVMEELNVEEESKINCSLDFETRRNLQFNKEGIMQQYL